MAANANDPRVVGLTLPFAERVGAVVKSYEAASRSGANPPGTPPRFVTPCPRPAKTGSAIAAGATGTVTFKVANATTGALTDGTETVSAINPTPRSVGAGKLVWLNWYAGFWYVANEVCTA